MGTGTGRGDSTPSIHGDSKHPYPFNGMLKCPTAKGMKPLQASRVDLGGGGGDENALPCQMTFQIIMLMARVH